MSAYVISEVEILDESLGAEYRSLAASSIQQYGGRYLVRGAVPEIAEGTPSNDRLVIVEFPSMDRLREWYASPEYAQALQLRQTALRRKLTFVEGVAATHPRIDTI
jgi:uncharacterized protein (DUF1330 family)